MRTTPLLKEHYESAIRLQIDCFGPDWEECARADFTQALNSGDTPMAPRLFTAIQDDKVIGTIMSSDCALFSNLRAWSWIAVHKDHRGQGVAKALISHAEQHAITHVFKGNAGTFMVIPSDNHGFYKSCGYTETPTTIHDGKHIYTKIYAPD